MWRDWPAGHELRPLELPRLCACGQLATERDGRCEPCSERHFTYIADAREEKESC